MNIRFWKKKKISQKAIKESIAIWEDKLDRILTNRNYDIHPCPLCEIYEGNNCKGCPVSEASERKGCYNTPFFSITNDNEIYHKNEILFLKSLVEAI